MVKTRLHKYNWNCVLNKILTVYNETYIVELSLVVFFRGQTIAFDIIN